MSTRRLRNTWWVDFSTEGVRYRKRSPENSQAGARAYEAVLRQRVSKGESLFPQKPPPLKPLFKDFAEEWFQTYVITNNKPSEQRLKRLTLRTRLVPSFGRLRLNDITSYHIELFKAEKMKLGLAPKTVNNYLSVLGRCLRVAHEWDVIERVPLIKFLKVPPQRFDFLLPEESDRLVQAVDSPKWRAMILVALRAGLRMGELLGLEWSNVDLETKMLAVRQSNVYGCIGSPKNNRERHLPLTNQVCESLRVIHRTEGYVFCRENGEPYVSHYSAERKLEETCKRAGIRRISWHALRHTFASHLVASGVPIRAVQELLGHSDIRMTMRYSHLAPSALKEAIQTLERNQDFRQPVGNTHLRIASGLENVQ